MFATRSQNPLNKGISVCNADIIKLRFSCRTGILLNIVLTIIRKEPQMLMITKVNFFLKKFTD